MLLDLAENPQEQGEQQRGKTSNQLQQLTFEAAGASRRRLAAPGRRQT